MIEAYGLVTVSRVATQCMRQIDSLCCIMSDDGVDLGLSEFVSFYCPRRDSWACESGVCLNLGIDGKVFVLWCLCVWQERETIPARHY